MVHLLTPLIIRWGTGILFYFSDICLLFSGSAFDPLGQSKGPAPPLEAKNEDTYVVHFVLQLIFKIICLI